MKMGLHLGGLLLPVLFLVLGCEAPAKADYPIEFVVRSDDVPLSSAEINEREGRTLGTTDQNGRFKARFKGDLGMSKVLEVHCPPDYISPNKPINFIFRRSEKTPIFDVSCPPKKRNAVLAIRAEIVDSRTKATPLARTKVKVFGSEKGFTDAYGVANVLVDVEPNETIQIVVDPSTSPQKEAQGLKAIETSVIVQNSDDVFLVAADFRPERAPIAPKGPVRRSGPRPKGPTGPINLGNTSGGPKRI